MKVDDLVHTTVRIECKNASGTLTSGTGFICNFCKRDGKHFPAIVTNRHIIKNAILGTFHMTTATEKNKPKYGEHVKIPLRDFESRCIGHPSSDVDLAVFPLGPVLNWLDGQGKSAFYRSIDRNFWADADFMNELKAIEEVVMIGYPNGLWDATNNLPIARRGTTATPPYIDFMGKPQFVIDCACFPGSSGSPIYLSNPGWYSPKDGGLVPGWRSKLLGVLWGGPQYTAEGKITIVPVPSVTQPVALSRIPSNLGYCIKASALTELDDYLGSRIKNSRE